MTCFTGLGLLLLSSGVLAQTKTVSGSITDFSVKDPLAGVSVVIKNTTTGTVTDVNGHYSISVQEGQTLRFSFIGYESTEVIVGSSSVIDVQLNSDVLSLGEVVVTAEFGMKRVARSIGSSVQNVKASDILESGRDNFITALQGRVAGMNVTSSGGAPGSSSTVVLRSITSISGNNQPLYVVDGVPMNNSTFDPSNFANDSYSVRNLDFASRGNDFNPEDIESMTVLKGAAAAALYGSDASNGAIIITTKKGTAGKGKVTYSNMLRWDKAYGYPDMQNKYANGAYGTTNWFYTTRYGGLYPEGTKFYDNIDATLQTGFTSKHNVSLEGGTDKTTVRFSASVLEQTGVIKTTDYDRMNISLAGKTEVNKWLNLESSMQYVSTSNNKALRGTEGPLYLSMRWPLNDDMSNYLSEDGSHMRSPNLYTDTDMLNPLFGLYKNKLYDESDRFISNISVNLTPVKNTFLRLQAGWDIGMQTFTTSTHPYYYDDNNGTGVYNISKSNFSDPTINIITGYSNEFFDKKLSFSAQFGYHQLENEVSRTSTAGTNYMMPDFQSINNCETSSSSQANETRRIQAVSGQFELGYKNMAFLTLRGRNDWSSTLPVENRSFFYPAMEASFVLSELSFFKENKNINFLKLRGSVAQVGKDAGPEEILQALEPTDLTGGGYKTGYYGPNLYLKPEMTTSYEIGFEGRLLNNRLNVDFTHFWTKCEDQIVKGFRLSYATGYILNNMNLGSFETWGWEAHVDGDILRTSNGFRWNVGINASHTGSEVVYLPENVTEYYNAYTWNVGNTRNGIMVGNSVTTLTGLAYTRNNNGDILIDPKTGLPMTNSAWSVIGDREPKLRFGLTTNLSYKNLRLSAMLSGRFKSTVVNGTKRLMMTSGTSWESVELRESGPVVFSGVLKDGNENTDNPTTNTISVSYDAYGASIFTGGDEDWLEKDINFLRLQELRISYNLPGKWLKNKIPVISDVNLYAAGNDLVTWTNYSGIDAVGNTMSAAGGGTGGEGIDVWSLPNPRGFSFGLSVTFK